MCASAQHVPMGAVDLSRSACTARQRAVFHAMGAQTIPRRRAFPPGVTSDTGRERARRLPAARAT